MKEVVAAVMRSYMRYGALSAKVRAMYGKRLRFSDFEHMAAMPSEQSVLEYLRGQPGWTAAVSALDTTGYVGRVELEEALRQQLWKEYRGLSHFVPKGDKLLVAFPVRLAELEDIMTALRRLKAAGHAKPSPPPGMSSWRARWTARPSPPAPTTTTSWPPRLGASTTRRSSTSGPVPPGSCPTTPPPRLCSAPLTFPICTG